MLSYEKLDENIHKMEGEQLFSCKKAKKRINKTEWTFQCLTINIVYNPLVSSSTWKCNVFANLITAISHYFILWLNQTI